MVLARERCLGERLELVDLARQNLELQDVAVAVLLLQVLLWRVTRFAAATSGECYRTGSSATSFGGSGPGRCRDPPCDP